MIVHIVMNDSIEINVTETKTTLDIANWGWGFMNGNKSLTLG